MLLALNYLVNKLLVELLNDPELVLELGDPARLLHDVLGITNNQHPAILFVANCSAFLFQAEQNLPVSQFALPLFQGI
ncbi:MAG: hypothetical protein JST59_00305 [Actinobacteria bacterium]|nr:hypothetical protein [Actinomycetota bacterium]